MFNILDLSSDLFNLVFSHLHNTDVQSFKRTNTEYHDLNRTFNTMEFRISK